MHRVSRVEDRERLLAEALAHAEALEKQYKVIPADLRPGGRWKAPVAAVVFALAVAVAVFPPAWVAGAPAPTPTEGELSRGLRAAVLLQAQQVEAFRVRHGRLPEALADLPSPLPGMTFVRTNNRVFQIRGVAEDGTVVVYDSAAPSPAFHLAAPWLPGPAAP